MKLPAMVYSDGIRKHKQVKFGGLNHARGAEDGELYDMRNLCSDDYPVLSVRPKRYLIGKVEKPNGLFYWKGLMWVDGTNLYFEGKVVGQVADSKKTFGALGPYIVILPDKVYFHVVNKTLRGMEVRWTETEGMRLRITDAYKAFDDDYAYVNAKKYNALCVRGTSSARSDGGENPAPNFSEIFKVGNAVRITGTGMSSNGEYSKSVVAVIRGFYRNIDKAGYVGDSGETLYYSYSQIIFSEGTLQHIPTSDITVEREVPDLKYLCEDGNRLWGCDGDTIYASKLGDPLSWCVYDGLETDSWALTPASSGEFTGCINYQGYPTFFKEDRLYKVYGALPSAFSVVDSPCLGVAAGCSDTLALAWGSLFYLGTNGPMIYTGSLPRPVGQELGNTRFIGGSAGSDGLKYYASLVDPAGGCKLYVYDVQRGLWHIEDELDAVHLCRVEGDLYCMDTDGNIWILGEAKNAPEDATEEEEVTWAAEFSDFTQGDPNHKGVSKLQLRLGLEEGSRVTVLFQFDSDGVWRSVRALEGKGEKRSYYLPIIPRRCDHYRIRLEGTGRASLYSLVRESYSGSERNAR